MPAKKLIGKKTKLRRINVNEDITGKDIAQNFNGAMRNIAVEMIKTNENQPRQYFDPEKMDELVNSVKNTGIIQPVIIRIQGDEIYLVAGERRLRAAKEAGLAKIPAVITEGDPAHIALIENIQRENLRPVEEAEAMHQLMAERNYTQEELAKIVGKAKSTVSEILSLTRLPQQIKDEVRRAEHYPKRLLVEVVKKRSDDEMLSFFEHIKDNNLKSDAIRKISKAKKRTKKPHRRPVKIAIQRSKDLAEYIDSKLIVDELDDNEKESLVTNFEDLKTIISKYLDTLKSSN